MPKHVRPWLRFMEGTDGGQAGGDGGQQTQGGTGAQGGAGDASKATGGDQGTGDRGNGDGDDISPAAQRIIDAVQAQAKASEPAPKDKPGDKADEPTLAQLLDRMNEQQKIINALKESDTKAAQERRLELATQVAKDAKLPEAMAARLTGDTREQLEADAKELAKAFGALVVDPAQGQGGGKTTGLTMEQAVAAKIAAAGLK